LWIWLLMPRYRHCFLGTSTDDLKRDQSSIRIEISQRHLFILQFSMFGHESRSHSKRKFSIGEEGSNFLWRHYLKPSIEGSVRHALSVPGILRMKLEAEDEALRQAEDDGHAPGHGQHPLDPLGGSADREWSKDC
jgi:hypothetical protein